MWHNTAAATTTTTTMTTWMASRVLGDNADRLSTRRDMASDRSIMDARIHSATQLINAMAYQRYQETGNYLHQYSDIFRLLKPHFCTKTQLNSKVYS